MANFQVLRLLARARLGVRDSGGLELVLSTDEKLGKLKAFSSYVLEIQHKKACV